MGRPKPTYRTTLNVSSKTRDRVNEKRGYAGIRTVDEVLVALLDFREKHSTCPKRMEL